MVLPKQKLDIIFLRIHKKLKEIGYSDLDLEDIDDEHAPRWSSCLERNYDLTANGKPIFFINEPNLNMYK